MSNEVITHKMLTRLCDAVGEIKNSLGDVLGRQQLMEKQLTSISQGQKDFAEVQLEHSSQLNSLEEKVERGVFGRAFKDDMLDLKCGITAIKEYQVQQSKVIKSLADDQREHSKQLASVTYGAQSVAESIAYQIKSLADHLPKGSFEESSGTESSNASINQDDSFTAYQRNQTSPFALTTTPIILSKSANRPDMEGSNTSPTAVNATSNGHYFDDKGAFEHQEIQTLKKALADAESLMQLSQQEITGLRAVAEDQRRQLGDLATNLSRTVHDRDLLSEQLTTATHTIARQREGLQFEAQDKEKLRFHYESQLQALKTQLPQGGPFLDPLEALVAKYPNQPFQALWEVLNIEKADNLDLVMAIVHRCGVEKTLTQANSEIYIKSGFSIFIGAITPFLAAALAGRVDAMRALIEANANIQAKDTTFGLTAIHLAALSCNPKAIKYLLRKGMVINAKNQYGDTPLHLAALYGMLASIEFLVAEGADVCDQGSCGRPIDSFLKSHTVKCSNEERARITFLLTPMKVEQDKAMGKEKSEETDGKPEDEGRLGATPISDEVTLTTKEDNFIESRMNMVSHPAHLTNEHKDPASLLAASANVHIDNNDPVDHTPPAPSAKVSVGIVSHPPKITMAALQEQLKFKKSTPAAQPMPSFLLATEKTPLPTAPSTIHQPSILPNEEEDHKEDKEKIVDEEDKKTEIIEERHEVGTTTIKGQISDETNYNIEPALEIPSIPPTPQHHEREARHSVLPPTRIADEVEAKNNNDGYISFPPAMNSLLTKVVSHPQKSSMTALREQLESEKNTPAQPMTGYLLAAAKTPLPIGTAPLAINQPSFDQKRLPTTKAGVEEYLRASGAVETLRHVKILSFSHYYPEEIKALRADWASKKIPNFDDVFTAYYLFVKQKFGKMLCLRHNGTFGYCDCASKGKACTFDHQCLFCSKAGHGWFNEEKCERFQAFQRELKKLRISEQQVSELVKAYGR